MRSILSINNGKLSKIKAAEQRTFMESCVNSLCRYAEDCQSRIGHILIKSSGNNKSYINMFFWVVDYLYQYYEFDLKFFRLLNLAATNLERLSQEKIAALSIDEEKEASRSELGDYLDKVTLIFQTAADKTNDTGHDRFYAATAEDYSRRADSARGVASTQSYTEKIVALYEKAAEEHKDDFLGEIFRNRAAEYREKCEAKETPDSLVREREARTASLFSPFEETETTEGASDTTPLLGSHRELADGLRRRTVRREKERPTSTPSPSYVVIVTFSLKINSHPLTGSALS